MKRKIISSSSDLLALLFTWQIISHPMKSLANNVWTKGCSITILELHSPVTILPIHSQSSHLHCSNSDYSIKNSWKITTSCRARVSTSACAPMNQRHTGACWWRENWSRGHDEKKAFVYVATLLLDYKRWRNNPIIKFYLKIISPDCEDSRLQG